MKWFRSKARSSQRSEVDADSGFESSNDSRQDPPTPPEIRSFLDGRDRFYPGPMDQAWIEWTSKRKLLVEGSFLVALPLMPETATSFATCANFENNMVGKAVDTTQIIANYPSTLERLYHCAKDSQIKLCPNQECQVNKAGLSKSIGVPVWCASFFEWMIHWFSCHLTCLAHYHKRNGPRVEINLSLSLLQCLENPKSDEKWNHLNSYVLPDRLVYDMVEWIYRVDAEYSPDRSRASTLVAAHSSAFWCPEEVYEEDIKNSIAKADRLGICKYRLFNIISCCPRGHQDLPALLAMIDDTEPTQAEHFRHREDFDLREQPAAGSFADSLGEVNHQTCTADHCDFALLDNTRVVQRHKCREHNISSCPSIQFPRTSQHSADRLIWKPVPSSSPTLQTYPDAPSLANGEYIAISHVWSDGTGAGTKGSGVVNSCLFRYFCDVAKALNCQGVWWDTISIPSDPKLRVKALRNMQLNFSSAKHTVVHDEYLVNFPWKDDGTPCLALILSPWFTRGWTAVELVSSKSVKVLFKDPNNERVPLIKDLKSDILANRPHHSLGHEIASKIIRRLQRANIEPRSLGNLMRNLKSRNNSWPRDRMVVAGLLAGVKPDMDAVNMEARILQQIITSYPRVDASILIHGSPTVVESGPLSWCPTNLFSGPATILPQDGTWELLKLDVDKDSGSLKGTFLARSLSAMGQDDINPFSMHNATEWKLRSALNHPSEYLVLTCHPRQRFCLVVKPTQLPQVEGDVGKFIECDWIGVVLTNISHDAEGRFRPVRVQIGSTSESPELFLRADDVLSVYHGQESKLTRIGEYISLEPISKGYEWSIENQRWEKNGAPYLGLFSVR